MKNLLFLVLLTPLSLFAREYQITGHKTVDDFVFELANNDSSVNLTLDCQSFVNYLYIKDDTSSLDFYLEPEQCEDILSTVKTQASVKKPVCLKLHWDDGSYSMSANCETKKIK